MHLDSESHVKLKKCLGHVSVPKQKKVRLIESEMKIKPNLGQLDGPKTAFCFLFQNISSYFWCEIHLSRY